MRIFYELRYTNIEFVRTFSLKGVIAKYQKYLKHIYWVISGTGSSKLSRNPRHPSRHIRCIHRDGEYVLHRITRKLEPTTTSTVITMLFSFDRLYIWRRKWDTAGFVRAQKRKCCNALTVGRGHADDGCSCNHRAVSPSVLIVLERTPFELQPITYLSHREFSGVPGLILKWFISKTYTNGNDDGITFTEETFS